MSLRYKGAVISATPPTTTGGNSGTAPGAWTLQQQLQAQGAGNWPNQPVYYIEDVFSTWLYTGNGATQTITNGIDLSTYGGLVWAKKRSSATAGDHLLVDTVRGYSSYLFSNLTNAADPDTNRLTSFNSNGFSLGSSARINESASTFVSWTFRKQPKFFDVVTWTGNGSTAWRYLDHSLGSTPKCIIVKRTDTTSNWVVWHNDGSTDRIAFLNTTAAADPTNGSNGYAFGISSTQFVLDTVGSSVTATNANGGTYVAYLFAHNAGGFGLTGTDNVISCGSFTTDSVGAASVTLGYEPQWMLFKGVSGSVPTTAWYITDNMRGWSLTGGRGLSPNSSSSEFTYGDATDRWFPTATGFSSQNSALEASTTYIYIAIRRGPMKTPTSGTSVFAPGIYSGTSSNQTLTTNFPVDFYINTQRNATQSRFTWDRLRGQIVSLQTENTSSESTWANTVAPKIDSNTGIQLQNQYFNTSGESWVYWPARRAPGFLDVVCYTGTGSSSSSTINHNLGVAPEMIITKCRNDGSFQGRDWKVWTTALSTTVGAAKSLYWNLNAAQTGDDSWAGLTRTATTYSIPYADFEINASGKTYVSYLFASCPGVSKVGSYTGTGATQTISCGFAARFVIIKRQDSTGDWWIWDTARGMVSGTDPRLSTNLPYAETNANWVYTNASGFQIVTTDASVNANGGSYIYLAIA